MRCLLLGLPFVSAELPADDKREQIATGRESRARDVGTSFAPPAAGDPDPFDADATPEGKLRLREIEGRAKEIYERRQQVEQERRPMAVRRDTMRVDASQAAERLKQMQREALGFERLISQLDQQIRWTTGSLRKDLQVQQGRHKASLTTLQRKMAADRKRMDGRTAEIHGLNGPLSEFDERLRQCDEELSECRRQWLGIRRPLEKYSRCDFEALRRVLDDWLVMDGLWPEAFAWAALCAYELNDIEAAASYLDNAQRLRERLAGSKKRWGQLEALRALVYRRLRGQSAKAQAAAARAIGAADRESSWETFFLLGRYYSDRPDDGLRAASCFQRALAIQPAADCARLWLARLQTSSTLPAVRDLRAGTAILEELWEKSGRKSWRLASFLAEAYFAGHQVDEAAAMWRTAIELAPAEFRYDLARRAGTRDE